MNKPVGITYYIRSFGVSRNALSKNGYKGGHQVTHLGASFSFIPVIHSITNMHIVQTNRKSHTITESKVGFLDGGANAISAASTSLIQVSFGTL